MGIYALRGSGADTRLERINRVELTVSGPRTEVPELIDADAGDVVLVNDDDLTYSMIRLDQKSLETVIQHIGDFTESMPRTLCWSATWQMVRAGQMRARDFIELVLSGMKGEKELSVLERVVAQGYRLLPLRRGKLPSKWVSNDLPRNCVLLEAARHETDSNRALIYVNALATVATSSSDVLEAMRAIVDEKPASVGLGAITVDTDMRWRALKSLGCQWCRRRGADCGDGAVRHLFLGGAGGHCGTRLPSGAAQ